jgi:hypothetical protein
MGDGEREKVGEAALEVSANKSNLISLARSLTQGNGHQESMKNTGEHEVSIIIVETYMDSIFHFKNWCNHWY